MPDTTPVVRWRRPGRPYTRWHIETATLNDAIGRTGCGKRFERRLAEHGTAGDGELCRNCVKALGGAVPGEPEPGT